MKKLVYTLVAGASLALAACTSQPQAAESVTPKKDIGLQLYSIRQLIGNAEKFAANQDSILTMLAGMGYTTVETANYRDGKIYGMTPEDFKACVDKAGLKALSTHTTRGLSKEELKAGAPDEETMKWWDECIAAHKAAGMEYVVTPSQPKNLIVPVGTAIADVLYEVGADIEKIGKILYGGPMMGIAVYSVDDPILKNNNAITALSIKDSLPKKQTACIHCGRCASVCPMGLLPTVFAKAMNVDAAEERAERLESSKINLCIECGSCSFICPAARPLVETNRLAKADLREYAQKKKEKEEKAK